MVTRQPLEPLVFLPQLLEPPDWVNFQPNALLIPLVERLRGDPYLPDPLRDRYTYFHLLQDLYNLFHRKSLPIHGKSSHVQV